MRTNENGANRGAVIVQPPPWVQNPQGTPRPKVTQLSDSQANPLRGAAGMTFIPQWARESAYHMGNVPLPSRNNPNVSEPPASPPQLPSWWSQTADAAAALVNPNPLPNRPLEYKFSNQLGGQLPAWANYVAPAMSFATPLRTTLDWMSKVTPDGGNPIGDAWDTFNIARRNWLNAYNYSHDLMAQQRYRQNGGLDLSY